MANHWPSQENTLGPGGDGRPGYVITRASVAERISVCFTLAFKKALPDHN